MFTGDDIRRATTSAARSAPRGGSTSRSGDRGGTRSGSRCGLCCGRLCWSLSRCRGSLGCRCRLSAGRCLAARATARFSHSLLPRFRTTRAGLLALVTPAVMVPVWIILRRLRSGVLDRNAITQNHRDDRSCACICRVNRGLRGAHHACPAVWNHADNRVKRKTHQLQVRIGHVSLYRA
jgi:hypothetical protein